ncbi:MAG: hypothetical protein K8S23_06270 [Candidatus Cloacimonetes bacterium]|nr:hypothetical protein [Candidatus Cloacimonadota bacterium]
MKKSFVLGIFIIFTLYAFAQTYHTGTISTDETWLAADNPHICTGDVTISSTSNPTVTIEPGVIIKIDQGKAMYVGHTSSAAYAD